MEQPNKHRGWYSRGYLPHFDGVGAIQAVGFRLADSIPTALLAEWKRIAQNEPTVRLSRKIERYLDEGHGACVLANPEAAAIVENALLHFDGQRYRMLAWVVMPNHVHCLFETFEGYPLSDLAHSWKSYTSTCINRALGRSGNLWQDEVFDRFVRTEQHFSTVVNYIHENPVKARLVQRAEEWRFSSAYWKRGERLPG